MGTALRSLDDMHAAFVTHGGFVRVWTPQWQSNTTASTSTSGGSTWQRQTPPFVMPSMGASVDGCYFPTIDIHSDDGNTGVLIGIEYDLGRVAGNSGTGTFTAGVSMPMKPVNGVSTQTASQRTFVYVDTVLPAVSPTLTITYVNQNGVAGRTATITLPASSAVASMFDLEPHLQSGDTGIRSVTGITWTGSLATGIVRVVGVLVLNDQIQGVTQMSGTISPMQLPVPIWRVNAGDTLVSYRQGTAGGGFAFVILCGIGDNV